MTLAGTAYEFAPEAEAVLRARWSTAGPWTWPRSPIAGLTLEDVALVQELPFG
ncbi:hypothetical protein [Streptomyces sp. NPDC094149]|uniref:hypothetical protein n=1 Tax=Streptomyces sp. NPDC094149 TaxID=3155079 RepID=UPI00331721AA